MALVAPAKTPTVAIARALRRAGLHQGKDIAVRGMYRNRERHFTYVVIYTLRAVDTIIERADDLECWTAEAGFPFKVSIHYATRRPTVDVHNGPGERVRETAPVAVEEPAVAAPAPAVEEPAAADAFQTGDIVAIDGRPGDWELMAPAAADVWTVEPARRDNRTREEVPAAALRPLVDAPRVRRGDLAVQHYPEQERGGIVGNVYRLGRWVCEKTITEPDGRTWSRLDDVSTQVVVSPETVDNAVRLDVEHGEHRGRIVQAIVSRHAGRFRVTCGCLTDTTLEVCRSGRVTGWCSSLEAARALWEWHAAGQAGPAPADFETPTTPPVEAPAAEEPAAVEAPAVSCAEDYLQERQAKTLGWSTRHAEIIRWAAAGQLRMNGPDDLRRVPAPGRTGRRVAAARLRPLAAAGLVTLAGLDEEGRHRVEITGDGRRALEVWDRKSPTPAAISPKQEGRRHQLRPLLGGEEARRRSAELRADLKRRAAERETWYAGWKARRAAEELRDRCWDVWAAVQGIRNRLGRHVPAGWAPTDEEARLHCLDPEVVAHLRAEAARLTAEAAAAAAVEPEETSPASATAKAAQGAPEGPAVRAPGSAPKIPAARVRPGSPRHTASTLTLQSHCVSIGVSEGPTAQTAEGTQRHDRHPHPQHRGRRRQHRGPGREGHRRRRPRGPRPGNRGRAHDLRRGPGRHPLLL